ncbi:MAG: hypothetical protein BMS9Abin11_1229 [Gammaproteobacteria bacterium]|nr:MAG: hypothetical protein BMS9Abin11_1229 [Gammaproteobacteria bacterium]
MIKPAAKITFSFVVLTTLLAACGSTPQHAGDYGRDHRGGHANANVGHKVAKVAKRMVGIRYRYGGNSPRKGFDCSGLVQYSYQKAGIRVPRVTRMQRQHSFRIAYSQLRRGDLIFFNQLGRKASHVGIYIGNNQFVHAPSSGKRIRISPLTKNYWQRHLESIRRFNIR